MTITCPECRHPIAVGPNSRPGRDEYELIVVCSVCHAGLTISVSLRRPSDLAPEELATRVERMFRSPECYSRWRVSRGLAPLPATTVKGQ